MNERIGSRPRSENSRRRFQPQSAQTAADSLGGILVPYLLRASHTAHAPNNVVQMGLPSCCSSPHNVKMSFTLVPSSHFQDRSHVPAKRRVQHWQHAREPPYVRHGHRRRLMLRLCLEAHSPKAMHPSARCMIQPPPDQACVSSSPTVIFPPFLDTRHRPVGSGKQSMAT